MDIVLFTVFITGVVMVFITIMMDKYYGDKKHFKYLLAGLTFLLGVVFYFIALFVADSFKNFVYLLLGTINFYSSIIIVITAFIIDYRKKLEKK